MNWFKRKKRIIQSSDQQVLPMKPINYHPKIILAWAKAIDGNDDLLLWLKDHGYEELTYATYAIFLKEEARVWLTKNGYPHLMAFINAAEGNASAQKWLLTHDFEMLYHMALAIESEKESWDWLSQNVTADLFLLTQNIKKVKDKIEENHNDFHTFRKDR